MRKVFVKAVGIQVEEQVPVILLQEEDGTGVLPIGIGRAEARAIVVAMQELEPPRPISYDLMSKVLKCLNASLEKVVVHELKDDVFHARFVIKHDEKSYALDARPSDSIAMALRTDAPIFISDKVADRALVRKGEREDEEDLPGEVRNEDQKFKNFVDEVFENVAVEDEEEDD